MAQPIWLSPIFRPFDFLDMAAHRLIYCCLLVSLPIAAGAENLPFVSKAADATTVSIYRDPTRKAKDPIPFEDDSDVLRGYAMITETRTVDLPPGEVVIRLENVASSIVPQSAILLDNKPGEKNFDRRLLSQRGLLDAFTGQKVRVRITDQNSGKMREEDATIMSHPDRLILKTARGYEALKCDGGLNAILFPNMPVDLTAKPTLSMKTRPDSKGGKMTLTLAYLADNFDWKADYVVTLSPNARNIRLFGWMTIASKDRTAFLQTELSAVAGEVFRTGYDWAEEEEADAERKSDPYSVNNIALRSECWPDTPRSGGPFFSPEPIPSISIAFPEPFRYCDFGGQWCNNDGAILVTGSRIAKLSDVGDVKLYSVPFPTDVQPQSMKQVRLMKETPIIGETLYTLDYRSYLDLETRLVFRFANKAKNGGGMPLPAGSVRFFQHSRDGNDLIGTGHIDDKAVGGDVELIINDAAPSTIKNEVEFLSSGSDWEENLLKLENTNQHAILAEVRFEQNGVVYSRFSKPVKKHRGALVWRVEIQPQAKAEIRFQVNGCRRERVGEMSPVRLTIQRDIELAESEPFSKRTP